MIKQILAALVGYLFWSLAWVGYNPLLQKFGLLSSDPTQKIHDLMPLLALLLGSFVLSIVAGYLTALISGARRHLAVLLLGVLLLATGIFVQIQVWHLMPLWYHLAFLALLVPFCFVGAGLRRNPAG